MLNLKSVIRLCALLAILPALFASVAVCQSPRYQFSTEYSSLSVGERTSGIGAAFGVRITRRLNVESTFGFYPGNPRTFLGGAVGPVLGTWKTGSILQGTFGPKFNVLETKRVALFVKAKPGFISFGDMKYEVPSIGGNTTANVGRMTGFAFDIGGGIEVAPSRNTVLRFDVGDTYFKYPAFSTSIVSAGSPAGTGSTFNFAGSGANTPQFSVGVGYRFGRTK